MLDRLSEINGLNGSNVYRGGSVQPSKTVCSSQLAGNSNIQSSQSFTGILDFLKPQSSRNNREKKMYDNIYRGLDQEGKRNLEALLKTGKLTSRKNSADGSSTLENLYKIATEPRAASLTKENIMAETLRTLANPFTITQKFGKIPDFITAGIIANKQHQGVVNSMGLNSQLAPHFSQTQVTGPFAALNPKDMDVTGSGTCVAASIEFNLADKSPEEFARYVAGITSPAQAVQTKIKLDSITADPLTSLSILNQFGVEYKVLDWDNVIVTLRPDPDAIYRARVQNIYHEPSARSSIDTMLQSTFMQLGSANGYNSLIDKRACPNGGDPQGLVDYEKDFVETIVKNQRTNSIVYQDIESKKDELDINKYFKGGTLSDSTIEYIQQNKESLLFALKDTNNASNVKEYKILGLSKEDDGSIALEVQDTTVYNSIPEKIKSQDLIPRIDKFIKMNNYLKGYKYDHATTLNHLLTALQSGSNIIIGKTETAGENKKIIGGHEITITGIRKADNGELYFIYNDTDRSTFSASQLESDIELVGSSNMLNPEQKTQFLLENLDKDVYVPAFIREIDINNKEVRRPIIINGYIPGNEPHFFYEDPNSDEISAKELIPKIHHAGIAERIVKPPEQPDLGLNLLKELDTSRKENRAFNLENAIPA